MSAFEGWSQRNDATLYLKRQDGVCADEAKILSRVQYGREDGVVGPLAARGVVEIDWSGVRQALIVYIFPVGAVWRDTACATAAVPAGAEPFGARRDIERHCGGMINTLDGQVAGPLALDGVP